MNIYKIFQTVNNDYDTYDSAIVAAETEEEAKRICPEPYHEIDENDDYYRIYTNIPKEHVGKYNPYWCAVKDVQVEYLGTAKEGTEKGVLLASFNAG